ncbi:bifunctional tRNA (5-methylaminomethyl-2-thiouridine)(34)-methyltransferase MnmD/FAD-dependent 5-carboxymethylaminomethyl-2-thiouridine(34) oxidoreductase MnmC [Chitinibacter bivalviorum]|uniref:tRNA 5-methylaminomethyl-2-thiouridine biosynthesis bifunctional protein MnmC n=1 Tax=Chitinibacter bivalviorum TaxID=2739434 RepID=A0A7H9BHF6_9NEIS|nr:bifunctional tRNA (5-methylaminomethyl-2-thiouridine)(34)-methyltransferase MnmD/FAD-dependent 5-carboxymethylaminomethyl-2-thiouridine(34) oxidoreductase MnmC [Chitinibacter bivalviorum]QLG87696.1 bifunctional tRNA (5-methylaminomethyl-2-thiouridine)(34)-methyltransferase MnmD/FAD-dependent 5-carboxymethylaminomethyl-2-thiouridine(34) oxidoreductase MnmC [Chitinibacter bivalviorum]
MIQAAQLEYASDGTTLYSSRFNDVYHAAHGAKAQALSVFLAGNQLPQRWQNKDSFTIIETGFGQGISFLTTWQAWRNDARRSARLHFLSVEQFPFSRDDLAKLHRHYPEFATLSTELLQHWPHLTPGFHRIYLDNGCVTLTLLFGDALPMLHEVVAKVDAIYLDGFSPSKNPEMWCLPVFKALWRLCKAETTLATYTVSGHVRRELTEAGFAVQKVAGFANKRQMLVGHCARLPRAPRIIRQRAPEVCSGEQSAIVIGAGMAGCAIAASLARRDWQVQIFEAESEIAQKASGNHIGLCHPTFSMDDNALARLSRQGFAITRQHLLQLHCENTPVQFGLAGQFQIAKDDAQEMLMQEIVASLQYPPTMVQYLNADEAQLQLGTRPARGGWWFAEAAWLNPRSLCEGYLQQGHSNISLQINTPIAAIKYETGMWHVYDEKNDCIAQSPILILANATAALQLWPDQYLPLSESWRAVTQIPADTVPSALPSCAGSSYLTAEWNGFRSLGAAPYLEDSAGTTQNANLASLQRMLPELPAINDYRSYTRICARPNSLDRLPLIGQLHTMNEDLKSVHQLYQMPREDGLYCALGFGSRGITWHALAAEIIAAQLNHEPMPIERSLLNAIDPARFLLRTLRKG